MTSTKYKITWKSSLLLLIGLVAFFVYVYIFKVDIQQIIAYVWKIDVRLYAVAAILVVLDTLFFTLEWSSLLRFLRVKISLFRLYLFVWVGVFIDTLIPAESISGEVSKIYLVNKEQNGTAGKATASIVAQRLIGMAINLVTLFVGAILLLVQNLLYGLILNLVLAVIAATFVFLALTLLLCAKRNWTLRILDALIKAVERVSRGHWKLAKLRQEAIETANSFHDAIKEYIHAPKTLLVASFFSIISWVSALVVFYLVFLSISPSNPQVSWGAILVISAIFAAVKSVPVGVPFEVGLPEIALSTLLILFGVPEGLSFTATILMRLLTLWLRFFIGFAAQQWLGIKTIMTPAKGEISLT